MKTLGFISTTALLVLLGGSIPAFAQEEHHEQAAKPAQHEQQAKPARQQAQAKSPRQQTQARPAQRQQQARPAKQEKQAKPNQRPQQARSTKPETRTRQVKREGRGGAAGGQRVQRTAAEQQRQRAVPALRLSARGNGRIPDNRFRSNFGRGHEFRIGNPTMVGGYSRFQYGGYWFGFVQPWPTGWYYTDDVYVDYINGGYYLCNPSYPGIHVAISVVM